MKLREDVELGLKQVIFFLSMTKKSSPRNSSLNCIGFSERCCEVFGN